MRNRFFILTMLLTTTVFSLLTGCREEGADERPGLYVDTDLIYAFPGKEVRLSGQASCFTGLQQLAIQCDAWKVNDVTDLSGQKPVVWNFDYVLRVPKDATFPQQLIITATDVHGTESKKNISILYAPATQAPYVAGLRKQMAIEKDTVTGIIESDITLTLYGEDNLQEAVVSIPSISKQDTFPLSMKEEKIHLAYTFDAVGHNAMTLTVKDNSGNVTVTESDLVAIENEHADPISDYNYLFAFKGNEQEENYLFGYYQYTERRDDYCYQVLVYAESDDTEFFFSPTRETGGARLFGESPFVDDRILSRQSQTGYVKGYKPGKGYWGLYIDLKRMYIEKWQLIPADASTAPLYHTGDWNGWKFDAMSKGATAYEQVADITVYKGNQYFAFATTTDWKNVWRTWKTDGGEFAGWWFSADGAGDGAPLPTIDADTDAHISFDTAIKWCTIKKR